MRRRFFVKNFFHAFMPVLVAILLIGSVAIHLTLNETRKNIEAANRQTVDRIQESVEIIFAEADAQSLNYSVSPSVMMRLEELLNEGYRSDEVRQTSTVLKTFLDSNVNSKEFLHSVYVYIENEKQNFFASIKGLANASNVGDTEWMERINDAPSGRQQWLEARTIEKFTGITNYKTDVISVFKWLHFSGRSRRLGVLVLNVHKGYLEKMFRNNLSHVGQSILMTGENGAVLCAASSDGLPDVRDMLSLEDSYFVQSKKNDALGIQFISLVPKTVLNLQSKDMMLLVVSAILISLFLCALIAVTVTKDNVRNIDAVVNLLHAAEQKQKLPEPAGGKDIYGYITQEIVKSYLERNRLDQQLIEKKMNLESMYFSFLQAQLNPHFLFNTLKNIYWKTVRLSGTPNEASKMIELLSSVLHYILVHPQRHVSLEQEIDNTRKYIQIQQMRFDHSFMDEWDVEPALLENKCIKFLLQPLVENSISHGLAGRKDGIISIGIKAREDHIVFSVRDNGAGITPGRLSEITRTLNAENSPVEHIGLYNVNRRLILAYDAKSALRIESACGEYTMIRFSIPRSQEAGQAVR